MKRGRTWAVMAGLAIATATVSARVPQSTPAAGWGTISRMDPALDRLIPSGATIEKVFGGLRTIEGPVWVNKSNAPHLLFSDIPGNTIYTWSPARGLSEFFTPVFTDKYTDGQMVGPNGLTIDREGRLVFCEYGNRRISRIERDGRRVVLVDRYEKRRLNSPNDLVHKSDGSLYFTDPFIGRDLTLKELDFGGVYRLSPDGTLHVLSRELGLPNGLAFSPDEKRLYVGNSGASVGDLRGAWMVYDVDPKGMLANGRVLLNPKGSPADGPVDGLKVDERGNLWATGPHGIWIINPEGRHLGTIQLRETARNVAFGDNDGRTLYVTAGAGVYRVRVNVRGASLPGY